MTKQNSKNSRQIAWVFSMKIEKLQLKASTPQQTKNQKAHDDNWNSLGKKTETDYLLVILIFSVEILSNKMSTKRKNW